MSAVRHAIFAYILLLVMLTLLVKLALVPLFSVWQEQNQASQTLEASLLDAKAQLHSVDQNKQLLKSELQSLLESGEIGVATKASDAGHRLQERIKLLLKPHSVKIGQLRPSNILVSDSLSKSNLELSIQLPTESLQPLLNAFLNSTPRLHLDLISIRSNARYSTRIQNNLEVNLNLSMWYVEDSSLAESFIQSDSFERAEGSLSQAFEQAEGSQLSLKRTSIEGNVLAGLFDANTRRHFASPSVKYYRLAAINVSENARIAIIANTADGRTRRLEQGDLLDVWQVDSIDSDGVNLSYENRTEVLNLSR